MDTQLTVSDIRHQAWALMLQEQVRSGLPITEWCAQQGISKKTFYYRRKQVREEMLQSAAPVFAELKPPAGLQSFSAGFAPAATITLNGISISVSNQASKQLLSDLLEAARHA